jgi:adenylylsulfate kinase
VKALRGEIPQFTGVSDPYEPPLAPEIHIRSDQDTPEESLAKIISYLENRGLIRRNGASPAED